MKNHYKCDVACPCGTKTLDKGLNKRKTTKSATLLVPAGSTLSVNGEINENSLEMRSCRSQRDERS